MNVYSLCMLTIKKKNIILTILCFLKGETELDGYGKKRYLEIDRESVTEKETLYIYIYIYIYIY